MVKYLVSPGPPLRLAGVVYPPGSTIEIFGRTQAAFFGDRLVPITDPDLIRSLEVHAHPFTVTRPLRWARQDYQPGDILFVAQRSQVRLLGDAIRPASGEEVLAWVQARQAPPGEMPVETVGRVQEAVQEPSTPSTPRVRRSARTPVRMAVR